MKLCIDCANFVPSPHGIAYAKCGKLVDPVDGEARYYCSTMRSNLCGYSGYHFVPLKIVPENFVMDEEVEHKVTFVQRVINVVTKKEK